MIPHTIPRVFFRWDLPAEIKNGTIFDVNVAPGIVINRIIKRFIVYDRNGELVMLYGDDKPRCVSGGYGMWFGNTTR
jgi:hypothetical protein